VTAFAAIVVVTNIGFTAAFDTNLHVPAWVAYDLDPSKIVRAERATIPFAPDPRVPDSDLRPYFNGSGYDRGHLCPAADMNWNTNALKETYYFSNIAPQVPSVNRGVWLDTENYVRRLAASWTVHVVIVPHVPLRPDFGGKKYMAVPDGFYKIVYGAFGARVWYVENAEPKTERR